MKFFYNVPFLWGYDYMHMCVHIYIYRYINTHAIRILVFIVKILIMIVYMCVCIYIYIYIYICVCMYVIDKQFFSKMSSEVSQNPLFVNVYINFFFSKLGKCCWIFFLKMICKNASFIYREKKNEKKRKTNKKNY